MKVELDKLYGVITGDIVGSSKLDPVQREDLFQVMKEGSAALKSWLGPIMPLEVDIYGGDTWQVLLTHPGRTLAAGLFFRSFLRSSLSKRDTRFAVAVGTIDFVPGSNVSEGDGEAFRLSGQTLSDGLGKRRMAFVSHDQDATVRWDVVFDLIDALVSNQWTENRSQAVTGALRQLKQEEIGGLWDPPIEQSSVNRHLQSSGWASVSRAITQFEEYWVAYDRI